MMNSLAPRPPKPSGSLGFPTMRPQATPPIMAPAQVPTATAASALAPAPAPASPPPPPPPPVENIPASVITAGGVTPAPTPAVPVAAPAIVPTGVMPTNEHGPGGQPKDRPDGMHIPGRMDRLGLSDILSRFLSGGGDMGAFRHGMHDVRQDWATGGRVGANPLRTGGSGLIGLLQQKLGIASAPPVAAPQVIPPIVGS